MKLIYVAGPLTQGNTIRNVRAAIAAGTAILEAGHAAYVPHLSVVWDWVTPQDYETWMALDFEIIKRCDGLLRLPGRCPGCEREVALAGRLNLPVFPSLALCLEWCNA